MGNEIRLDFYNSDGTLKPFEKFSEELKEIYQQLEGTSVNKFMNFLTGQSNDYSPNEILEKYHFLDRKLYLNDEITDVVAKEFLEKIQLWNAEDEFNDIPPEERGAIQIYINTPGGELVATWQIIDAIRGSKTPVVTFVTGTAYSGGFFIAIAGHQRCAFPHATFMFHEGSNCIAGDAHKTVQQAEFYKTSLKTLKKYVLENTSISSELYEKHKADDWFFDVNNALKYDVIDYICSDVNGNTDEDEEDEENEE